MSKKSKKKAKLKRRSEKAARKAAQRARYEGYMKAGNNTKSKRSQRQGAKRTTRTRNHPNGPCGNPGCIKCHGIHFRPFLRCGTPLGMPNWMWRHWDALTRDEQKREAA
jgi:hypothetical protein